VGLLLAGLVAAGAFGLLMTLKKPSEADELGVRAVARLDQLRSTRGFVDLSGVGTIGAVCVRWHGGELIRLSDGGVFAVSSTHVRSLAGPRILPNQLAAEADLAGCPRLLANELTGRLLDGGAVSGRAVYVDHLAAYALLLGRGRPVVELDVARGSFTPLGMRFIARRLHGSSDLLAVPLDRRDRGRARASP